MKYDTIKYKVGDRVRIKSHDELLGIGFFCSPNNCGRDAIIMKKTGDSYRIDVDALRGMWGDEMFEDSECPKYSINSLSGVRIGGVPLSSYISAAKMHSPFKEICCFKSKQHTIKLIGSHNFLILKVKP